MIDDRPADATETDSVVKPSHFFAPNREMIRWREDGAGPSRTQVYVGDRLCA
jgi:hypothetical protein